MTRFAVWAVMIFGGAAAGIALDLHWFRRLFMNPYFHLVTAVPGLVLLRLVLLASRNTGRALAARGREGEVARMETNRLVTDGMYACMRHPMHLGLLFFPLAVALIAGSLSFMLIIAPAEALFMIVMIKLVEEPQAIRKFGDQYVSYMRRTPAFSLRPRCVAMILAGEPEAGERETGNLQTGEPEAGKPHVGESHAKEP